MPLVTFHLVFERPTRGCRTQDSPFPPPPPPPFLQTRARAEMEMLKGRAKAVEGSFFKAETDTALLQHARTLPVSCSHAYIALPPVPVVPAWPTAAQQPATEISAPLMPARSLSVDEAHEGLRSGRIRCFGDVGCPGGRGCRQPGRPCHLAGSSAGRRGARRMNITFKRAEYCPVPSLSTTTGSRRFQSVSESERHPPPAAGTPLYTASSSQHELRVNQSIHIATARQL